MPFKAPKSSWSLVCFEVRTMYAFVCSSALFVQFQNQLNLLDTFKDEFSSINLRQEPELFHEARAHTYTHCSVPFGKVSA
jgi:hypothetical protein